MGYAKQSVPGAAVLAQGKEDIFKDWKCAKKWEFPLTEAGCISWTGDFLFMAHYNRLFWQEAPEKMYGDYSPFGAGVEMDAWFSDPWLFSTVVLHVFLVMALSKYFEDVMSLVLVVRHGGAFLYWVCAHSEQDWDSVWWGEEKSC